MSEHPIVSSIRGKLADTSQPFVILVELQALTAKGDAVAAAIETTGAVRLTQAEPGCLAYDLCRDTDTPDRFVLYERWCNLDALAAHVATPHFAALGAALAGLLTAAPAVRILAPV